MAALSLHRLRHNDGLEWLARFGLAARASFYLLLGVLAVLLAFGVAGHGDRQSNPNGALTQVADKPFGTLVLWAVVVGFVAYALIRVVAAVVDGHESTGRRVFVALQGLAYLGLALVVGQFLTGSRSTGSEQQQSKQAATVLGLPGGRVVLALAGLVVIGVCVWQFAVAAKGHFADEMNLHEMDREVRRATMLTGRVGIPARALAVLPVGVFLLTAAWRADPTKARGLDRLLLGLVQAPAGKVLVVLVGLGLLTFAAYTAIEARYKEIETA